LRHEDTEDEYDYRVCETLFRDDKYDDDAVEMSTDAQDVDNVNEIDTDNTDDQSDAMASHDAPIVSVIGAESDTPGVVPDEESDPDSADEANETEQQTDNKPPVGFTFTRASPSKKYRAKLRKLDRMSKAQNGGEPIGGPGTVFNIKKEEHGLFYQHLQQGCLSQGDYHIGIADGKFPGGERKFIFRSTASGSSWNVDKLRDIPVLWGYFHGPKSVTVSQSAAHQCFSSGCCADDETFPPTAPSDHFDADHACCSDSCCSDSCCSDSCCPPRVDGANNDPPSPPAPSTPSSDPSSPSPGTAPHEPSPAPSPSPQPKSADPSADPSPPLSPSPGTAPHEPSPAPSQIKTAQCTCGPCLFRMRREKAREIAADEKADRRAEKERIFFNQQYARIQRLHKRIEKRAGKRLAEQDPREPEEPQFWDLYPNFIPEYERLVTKLKTLQDEEIELSSKLKRACKAQLNLITARIQQLRHKIVQWRDEQSAYIYWKCGVQRASKISARGPRRGSRRRNFTFPPGPLRPVWVTGIHSQIPLDSGEKSPPFPFEVLSRIYFFFWFLTCLSLSLTQRGCPYVGMQAIHNLFLKKTFHHSNFDIYFRWLCLSRGLKEA